MALRVGEPDDGHLGQVVEGVQPVVRLVVLGRPVGHLDQEPTRPVDEERQEEVGRDQVGLDAQPEQRLSYTHFSGGSGLPDKPENYHTVTIDVVPKGEQTTFVALTQDNNASEEEKQHSEKNWGMMLAGLKKLLEG